MFADCAPAKEVGAASAERRLPAALAASAPAAPAVALAVGMARPAAAATGAPPFDFECCSSLGACSAPPCASRHSAALAARVGREPWVEGATTAVSRSWSDLDQVRMFAAFAAMSCAYTVLNMPITVATTRQQCMPGGVPLLRVLREVHAAHGVRGWYRGFATSLWGGLLCDQVLFVLLEYLKEAAPLAAPARRDFAAGCASDFVATPLWVPFSVIISRQVTAGVGIAAAVRYESAWRTCCTLVAQEGVRGLFKGTLLSMLMVPVTGLWWALYGALKECVYTRAAQLRPAPLIAEKDWSCTDNVWLNCATGCTTGAIITVLSNPLWVLRTRMQVAKVPDGVRWQIAFVARDVLAREGWRGFFRGLGGSVALSAASGIGFGAFYEGVKLFSDNTKATSAAP